jgi:hypothetical protein
LLRDGANRSQLSNTTNQPFLFLAPTGLAVGFALKEVALRHSPCGDSPQEPLFATQQLVPPLPFNQVEQDSAGCAGGQHNSTSTQKASDSPKFRSLPCFRVIGSDPQKLKRWSGERCSGLTARPAPPRLACRCR